jgi:hypothetical protein
MSLSNLQTRKLRVYAFDPSLGKRLITSRLNEITIAIPYDMELEFQQSASVSTRGPLPGPVGKYLEVVDYDPASGLFYDPIDLNTDDIRANHGLTPSEANPKFHQQMVYAVAMTTIAQFEDALGRVALWSPRTVRSETGKWLSEEYVGRLRIYPHALREANAYYSPKKKALLFGYFAADDRTPKVIPGSTIFTCLSHDIIAHETTHALLDGMHARFIEASNADVLALHEAFADVIAIFLHFSHSEVLEDQIAKTRGNLESENLLGQLAQEFGQALGRGAALRDALGGFGEDGKWKRHKPDRRMIANARRPHQRGAVLVAAIFDAFLGIYRDRTQDLFRIATGGSGQLPAGEIQPDLVKRLSHEAAKAASHLCRMCIRALDYCPPVDVTFGDYLRAIITADFDLFPDDERGYRTAIIESFSAWGIVPEGIGAISVDTLLWPSLQDVLDDSNALRGESETSLSADLGTLIENPSAILEWIKRESKLPDVVDVKLREIAAEIAELMNAGVERRIAAKASDRENYLAATKESRGRKYSVESLLSQNLLTLGLEANREVEWCAQKFYAQLFWAFLTAPSRRELLKALGLNMDENTPLTVYRDRTFNLPTLEVHAVRMATRRGSRNQIEREYVVEVTQRRRGFLDPDEQTRQDTIIAADGDFRFRRGCTLLIDARTFRIRRVIRTKGDVTSDRELGRVRAFIQERQARPSNALDGGRFGNPLDDEDFAHLHRSAE